MIPLKLVPTDTFSIKQLQGKICLSPFVSIEVDMNGHVRLCGCAAWMPATVGNLFTQSIQDILKSPQAQLIRASIIDGTYIFCNEKTCGVIGNNQLNDINNVPASVSNLLEDSSRWQLPHEIFLAGDYTCNLSCPSCRTEVRGINDTEREHQELLGTILRQNLFPVPTAQPIKLHLSTSGELFASSLLLKFLNSITPAEFPNLKLHIQTNGILLPDRWHRLGDMVNQVEKITVTVDAAQPHTYERLRRGGTWSGIQRALAYTQQVCQTHSIDLHLRMVVQKDNYTEVKEFYDMARSFGADKIEYVKIANWDTYTIEQFFDLDVFDSNNPLFASAQEHLNQVRSLPQVMISGGL